MLPEIEHLLGPAGSVEDVLSQLNEQYKPDGQPPIYFLPTEEPICRHLNELLRPVDLR